MEEAKDMTDEIWKEKYEKYINEAMSENQAKEKANRKTLWAVKRHFFARMKDFLTSYLSLKDDDTYQEIVEDLQEKLEKGMDVNKAMSRVILKYQTKFDGLFEENDEDHDSDDEEDEENENN